MTARRAAEELGISLATLYAYVSRGMIRSEAAGGRSRRYRVEDVRRLKERKERRRDPDRVVEGALHWGTPVMESAITLITDDGVYYRGRDVVALATRSTIEEVAALIWTGDASRGDELFPSEPPGLPSRIRAALGGGLPPIEAFQVLLAWAGAEDPAAYDLRPAAVARTGARILRLMANVVAGEEARGIAETLARGWRPDDSETRALLDSALVLCADMNCPSRRSSRAASLPPRRRRTPWW